MAWYEGHTSVNTAGTLIGVLNSVLLLNSYWSKVDDTANGMADNSAVYRCYDPYGVVDYYIKVDDNYGGSAGATIELWESWNSTTHAGIGNSLVAGASPTYYLKIYYFDSWAIQMSDFCFTYIYRGGNMGHYFIGRPHEVFDETKNIVLAIVRSVSTTSTYNSFGYGSDYTGTRILRFLFDENENNNTIAKLTATGPITTLGGSILIDECRVINTNTNLVVGVIHGNVCCGENVLTAYGGAIYQIQGKKWLCVGRSTAPNSLVLME